MNDTSPEVARRYHEMLMALPGAVRLRMACSMFQAARAIMKAQLPGLAEDELRVELFRRTYRGDFDPEASARIEAWLRRRARRPRA